MEDVEESGEKNFKGREKNGVECFGGVFPLKKNVFNVFFS